MGSQASSGGRPIIFLVVRVALVLLLAVALTGSAVAREKRTGSLRIESEPPGASLWVDGEQVGTTPERIKRLAAGRHEIRLTYPKYEPYEETVHIVAGEEQTVTAVLTPRPGLLTITSAPPGGEIWVDGKIRAKTQWSGEVAAGEHRVIIRLPGRIPAEEVVTVPPAGERTVDVGLREGTNISVGDSNDPLMRRQDRLFRWPSEAEFEGKRGAPMVLVPEGEFLMGSPVTDEIASPAEKPQRKVHLEAFLIDKYEVPNGMYRRFLEDVATDGHKWCPPTAPPDKDHTPGTMAFWGEEWNQARQSVTEVDWWDAAAYCAWAGKRLPTEAEWEKAARGTDGRIYPWGDDPPGAFRQGNFADRSFLYRNPEWTEIVEGYDDGYAWPAPIGQFPRGASPYGAEEMAGNLWEWVSDWYDEAYYRSGHDVDPRGPRKGERRVLRGGSWNDIAWDLRAASRLHFLPGFRVNTVGFRCAMDAPQPGGSTPRTPLALAAR
jgi:formylglycine-generating enzyme required for sulfatase activity